MNLDLHSKIANFEQIKNKKHEKMIELLERHNV